MADFDGAFLSFKVTTGGVKDELKEGMQLDAEDKTDLANIATDKISDASGMDIPDIPAMLGRGGMPIMSGSGLGAMPPKREFEWTGDIKGDNYFVMQARMVFLCFQVRVLVRGLVPARRRAALGLVHPCFLPVWGYVVLHRVI